jgi:integrase
VKAPKPHRAYLDRADAIRALLDAAGELDPQARGRPSRRALLATLTFAGLRISEALALRWEHIDLASERLHVAASKTEAGVRTVDLLPALRDKLASHRAQARATARGDLVFRSQTGGPLADGNVCRRILAPARDMADAELDRRGLAPMPERLGAHALRHTYASLLVALGESPTYCMS